MHSHGITVSSTQTTFRFCRCGSIYLPSKRNSETQTAITSSLTKRFSEMANFPALAILVTMMLLGAAAGSGIVEGPIKTLVVLVMENRSFDHVLGWMKRLNPQIDGVTGAEWNALSTADPSSRRIFFRDDAEYVDPNPGHSFQAIREQVFGSNRDASADPPPMNGFAQNAESMSPNMSEEVMKGFRPEAIPVYATLAREFAIFDRWFSSLPASTHPNRLFVYSGTSRGTTSQDTLQLAAGFPQRTIFDSLEDSGLSFGIYHHGIPTALFYRSLRQIKNVENFHFYDPTFESHAEDGILPNLVVIEPRYFATLLSPANDDHPSHDVSEGQALVKDVYETLRASPQWNQSLLVVTYDEHGGFYDHVPTPVANVPSPDGIVGPEPFLFKFDRLGVRVPTLMVSPWIDRGTLVRRPARGPHPSSEFEHSSIPATVKKMFNLSSDFLTFRDAWAGTFEDVVAARRVPRTDCPEVLPEPVVSPMRKSAADSVDAELSEFQEEVLQLAAVLSGERHPEKIGKNMKVKEAAAYADNAVQRHFEACREALQLGARGNTILDTRPPRS